jgi:co-chaperonin GroES (HSP10)
MIKVIRDNVLVKPFASDEKSAGGIIVSEAHRAVSQKVKVVAIGNGTKKCPMNWNEGDVAFRVKDSGDEVLIDGERHFIVKSNWLIAKLN